MAVSEADIAFATDLFSDLGPVTTRKMFGGICLYLDGTVFALMTSEGQLFLKAKPPLSDDLAENGAERFHNMPYWSLPEAALDDPAEACSLARKTLETLI